MIDELHAGIRFGDKHSYSDYGLYLSNPPDYGTPELKTVTLEIPGMDGVLDYTEAIAGDVKYSNREQEYTFVCMIDRWHREELKAEIMNDLHGNRVQIIPDEDPEWYFMGRPSVAFDDIDSWRMKVVITVVADPFRIAFNDTLQTVEASQFGQNEIVVFGKSSYTGTNSGWNFWGYDFSDFLRFRFRWNDAPYITAPRPFIQLVDREGHVYNKPTAFVGPTGIDEVDLDSIGDVLPNKISRVLVSGIGQVSLSAVQRGVGLSRTIHNNRMPVIPTIYSTIEDPVWLTVNGAIASVVEGENYFPDIKLNYGDNAVSLWTAEAPISGYIQFRYREGRL